MLRCPGRRQPGDDRCAHDAALEPWLSRWTTVSSDLAGSPSSGILREEKRLGRVRFAADEVLDLLSV